MEKNENLVIVKVASEIKEMGESIGKDLKEGSTKVRQFQAKWRDKLNNEGTESENRNMDFLIYFLCNFIHDFYYNLTGDFPYSKEVEEARKYIMEGIGKEFIKISGHLETSNFNECFAACANIIHFYMDKIQQLNKSLTPKVG